LLLSDRVKQEEPETEVFVIGTWPDNTNWREYLSTKCGWKLNDGSVLIIDEAQRTNGDLDLWDFLFKAISANPEQFQNRIILFSSYGSPNGSAVGGSPMVIPHRQKVTLRPIEHNDDIPPIGLFLTSEEFEDFISKKYPRSQFHFDTTFHRWVFDISQGHVGAIADVIRVVLAHHVCLHSFTPRMN
jgi:hypothetical protein